MRSGLKRELRRDSTHAGSSRATQRSVAPGGPAALPDCNTASAAPARTSRGPAMGTRPSAAAQQPARPRGTASPRSAAPPATRGGRCAPAQQSSPLPPTCGCASPAASGRRPGGSAGLAGRQDRHLPRGERYRRIVKRRGKLKALFAVARSILVIVWHLLADPAFRYADLGAGEDASGIDKDKQACNHIRQLAALGFTITLAPAA